ncbi:hypothetical protein ABW20_dc0107116 [Dactylellina cionopaga]|nr:hypothetical protein ABW20_dc0107116 [Dactylellina cionopaga]
MRSKTLAISTAITFATTTLAVPASFVIPSSYGIEKRSWTKQQHWPTYNGTFAPWKPVGCYSAEVALTYDTGMCSCMNAGYTGTDLPFTMEKCFAMCKGAGFRYAGIKGQSDGKSCWCGSGVSDNDKLSNVAKCDVPCDRTQGDPKKGFTPSMCGGKTTYSVWKDPCYKSFDKDEAPANYEYLGCFWAGSGWLLSEYSAEVSGDNLSTESCVQYCAENGYAFAGPYYWNQCYCGGKLAPYYAQWHKDHPEDNAKCTSVCSASAKIKGSIAKEDLQYCGAVGAYSVYYNRDLDYSETCEGGETSNSSKPPKPEATSKVTITITKPGPEEGTTTKTGSKTDTVIITTPTVEKKTRESPQPTDDEEYNQETVTVTTSGSKVGTTTKFVTDRKGHTITTSGTVSVIITTPTGSPTKTPATPKMASTSTGPPKENSTPPGDSCCVMPMPSSGDKQEGVNYPLGGIRSSIVSTSDKRSFTLIKLSGISSDCKTSYKYTIIGFQAACQNACVEQQKKCIAEYSVKKHCSTTGKKSCWSKEQLKKQCDIQLDACKKVNTKDSDSFKSAMDKCPGGGDETEEGYDD